MDRNSIQFAALVIDLNYQPQFFQLEQPAMRAPLSALAGFDVALLHSGYDPATDSAWSSWHWRDADPMTVVESIRKWNAENPGAKFPSHQESDLKRALAGG